jgi:uncharacterized protein (UPF0332 family)
MRPDDFLETADRLTRGTTEGDWRSAVSRAYYGVFHRLRDALLVQGLDVGRGGAAHFNLYSGLHNCGIAQVALVAQGVDLLRAARVWADYDLRRPFPQLRAAKSVQEAHSVVTDFQAVFLTTPLAHIVAGAKRYLQSIGHIP